MSTLYVKVPGTRGSMVVVSRVVTGKHGYKGRLPVYKVRAGQTIVRFAKFIACRAAFIEGHEYAEVWDKHRRLYATPSAKR